MGADLLHGGVAIAAPAPPWMLYGTAYLPSATNTRQQVKYTRQFVTRFYDLPAKEALRSVFYWALGKAFAEG